MADVENARVDGQINRGGEDRWRTLMEDCGRECGRKAGKGREKLLEGGARQTGGGFVKGGENGTRKRAGWK